MVMKRFTVLLFLFSAALVINSCGTPSHSAIRGAITLPSESDSELYLIPIEPIRGTTMGTLSQLKDYPFSRFIPVTYVDRVFFEDERQQQAFQVFVERLQQYGFDFIELT